MNPNLKISVNIDSKYFYDAVNLDVTNEPIVNDGLYHALINNRLIKVNDNTGWRTKRELLNNIRQCHLYMSIKEKVQRKLKSLYSQSNSDDWIYHSSENNNDVRIATDSALFTNIISFIEP